MRHRLLFPNKQKDAGEMAQCVKRLPHKIGGLSLNAQSYMKPDRSNTGLYSQGFCWEIGGLKRTFFKRS